MEHITSFTLIAGLMMTATPIVAQEPAATTDGPLTRAMTREAVRLAATGERLSSAIEIIQQDSTPTAKWSRVRTLAPGTEIIVTTKDSSLGQRLFVAADDSNLTVLNVTGSMLSSAAKDVLRDMAANHPDYVAVADTQSFANGSVRVAPDGVFVSDRKVADLGQVVETIARRDIAEITTRQKGRGVWGHLGSLGGYFVRAMSRGVVVGFACQAAVRRDRCGTWAIPP